jgi:hypothetical protein
MAMRFPVWLRLATIAVAGVIALLILGARGDAIVEIVSWMLLTAGVVKAISVMMRWREN